MFISKLKVLWPHGRQAIPNLDTVELPAPFRGRPILTCGGATDAALQSVVNNCPTGALCASPFSLDMGRCLFCGECARALPRNIEFTQDWRIVSLTRKGLVVHADRAFEYPTGGGITLFRRSLKLRHVCAGGDGSTEMELGAAGNVNFDMRRRGIEFTASPRHADGVVISGPITSAMAAPLQATFAAVPKPRILVVAGTDAISGGLFEHSAAINRSFFDLHTPDLYVAGNPPHPLTFIYGLLSLQRP